MYSSPGNDNIFNNSHKENENCSDSTGSNMSYFGIEYECEISERLMIIRTKIWKTCFLIVKWRKYFKERSQLTRNGNDLKKSIEEIVLNCFFFFFFHEVEGNLLKVGWVLFKKSWTVRKMWERNGRQTGPWHWVVFQCWDTDLMRMRRKLGRLGSEMHFYTH